MKKVLVENLSQYNKLMSFLEEQNYYWNSGHRPTSDIDIISYGLKSLIREGVLLIIIEDNKISIDRLNAYNDNRHISFNEFIKENTISIEWE